MKLAVASCCSNYWNELIYLWVLMAHGDDGKTEGGDLISALDSPLSSLLARPAS